MEDHVPRHAQMGAWVLINDRWYKSTDLRMDDFSFQTGLKDRDFNQKALSRAS